MLRQHPSLLVFPIIVSIATVSMLLALGSITTVHDPLPGKHGLPDLLQQVGTFVSVWKTPHPVLLAVYYLGAMLLATMSNVALYSETMRIYAGEKPSLSRGARFALARFMPILTWSLFGATVGLMMRVVGEKLGLVGKLVGFAASVTWSTASVFVYPVLAREGIGNPLALLRRSGGLVRATWGDLVSGYVRLGLSFGILAGLAGGLMLIVGWNTMLHAPILGASVMAVGFLVLFGLTLISNTLLVVYRCALYIYATEGVPPEPFDRDDMDQGWTIRSN